MSEATACSVCDEDPCVSGCTVRVPLIRLYMAIGTAQSGGHHADAAVMSRAIESHDGNSESVCIPGPVDEVVRRYGERAMTYDVTKNAEFATEEDDAMHLDWLDEARSGSDLHLLSGWVRARMEAYRAENADLIRRVREAEANFANACDVGRKLDVRLTQALDERDDARAERDAAIAAMEAAKALPTREAAAALLEHLRDNYSVDFMVREDAALSGAWDALAAWSGLQPLPECDPDEVREAFREWLGYSDEDAALRDHARKAGT